MDSESSSNIISTNDIFSYMILANQYNGETGIHLDGDIPIDDKTSIVIDKFYKCEDSASAIKNYCKVMDVRELDEIERENANKGRLFLKSCFEVLFKGQVWRAVYVLFNTLLIGYDIYADNIIAAIILICANLLYTSPIKFTKEIVRLAMLFRDKERTQEELKKIGIDYMACAIENDSDIKLYIKKNS